MANKSGDFYLGPDLFIRACKGSVSNLLPCERSAMASLIKTTREIFMKLKSKVLAATLAAAALGLAAPIAGFAQTAPDRGWYIGADIGRADFGSDKDTAFRILGGYQINRNFAAEIAYHNLYDKDGVKGKAWEFAGVGLFPLANRFSLLGKLGLARAESEAPGVDVKKTELLFGIGVQYDVNRNVGVRAQWNRINTYNEVDILSLGVIYRF
jgi:OOP family OmpA-OmpF porin